MRDFISVVGLVMLFISLAIVAVRGALEAIDFVMFVFVYSFWAGVGMIFATGLVITLGSFFTSDEWKAR